MGNKKTKEEVEKIAAKIAKNLKITGPFNIQFLAESNQVSVIECNLRASRSLPFVSKATGVNFAQIATEAILGKPLYPKLSTLNPNYVAVKAPQFSFSRIKGADPVLRVEMASTGEVATFGDDIYEAFLKSQIATGTNLPKKSVFISLAGDQNKAVWFVGQILNGRRQAHAFKRRHFEGDHSKNTGDTLLLAEKISPKTGGILDGKAEIEFQILLEFHHLFMGQNFVTDVLRLFGV